MTKPRNGIAAALRDAAFKQRVVKPRKGKGAYTRKTKHGEHQAPRSALW